MINVETATSFKLVSDGASQPNIRLNTAMDHVIPQFHTFYEENLGGILLAGKIAALIYMYNKNIDTHRI